MISYAITLGIIHYKNKYLIAKRADTKKFAPGQWEFLSGFIDTREPAEDIILRELMEELKTTGEITKKGDPYTVTDAEARWIIVPFLIDINNDQIINDPNEHSELKWVSNEELDTYKDLLDVQGLRNMGLIG